MYLQFTFMVIIPLHFPVQFHKTENDANIFSHYILVLHTVEEITGNIKERSCLKNEID